MKTIAAISMLVSALVASPTAWAQVGGAGGRREPPPTGTPVKHDPSLITQVHDYFTRLLREVASARQSKRSSQH